MGIKQNTENGNIAAIRRQDFLLYRNSNNWLTANRDANSYVNSSENYRTISNTYPRETNKIFSSDYCDCVVTNENIEHSVCNRQYRLNSRNSVLNSTLTNLAGDSETLASNEVYIRGTNVFSDPAPIEEESDVNNFDSDEMCEKGLRPVPRGIVNPNYPGFQHLAHTLQDYSSCIENFYQSENDMTDDDIDLENTESSCGINEQNEMSVDLYNITNNNNNVDINAKEASVTILDSYTQKQIPDLLKTVSKNNNNNENLDFDSICTDTDIENNFNKDDIIGDFNKEIEDEIKQLLNYNINIQDDLQELRQDIKESFAKPIENTINNISDVVNHVIKKLVENKNDGSQKDIQSFEEEQSIEEKPVIEQVDKNKADIMQVTQVSRPTFLYIDNGRDNVIADAFLSDGKDEIKIYDVEYNSENLSRNVEYTIKQLSTELRKIIPKLDQMRERDKLWSDRDKELSAKVTDKNLNEIASSSINCNDTKLDSQNIGEVLSPTKGTTVKTPPSTSVSKSRSSTVTEAPSVKSFFRNTKSNTSVQKNDSPRESDLGSFDVYNIETALPKLDLDAIESHLKAAKEAERRKRNDREEIRRRLAMGTDSEEYYSLGHTDRPGKKPSLHSRLQNGKNLQICFMNETASDNESQASDVERSSNNSSKHSSRSSIFSKSFYNHPYQTRPLSVNITKNDKINAVQGGAKLRPSSLILSKASKSRSTHSLGHIELRDSDFHALQSTLQTEARIALAQAKEMARIQMERERRVRAASPVTEMLRRSMAKAGAPLAPDRRRVSRQLLTDMNIAQLQVIVNELHSQIERLNDSLVRRLMARDELHMGQDSMLVDIEDLTRYLGVKEHTKKTKGTSKSGVRRLTSLVHK